MEHPSAQPATVVMRTLRRRPDRDRSSARACNSAPPLAGHGSSNVETVLIGVVKSVVNFLLWMLWMHLLSNVSLVFPLVNCQTRKWENRRSLGADKSLLRQPGPRLSFHDLLQQDDCLVIEVDAERSSLSCELQREPLCFWHVACCMLGADPHSE